MAPRRQAAALALAAATILFPMAATAACSTAAAGARCISLLDEVPSRSAVPDEAAMGQSGSAPTPMAEVGDVLPRGEYSVIINADYYGLPPVSDGWVYMRVGQDAFRVDWQSHQVLERVTQRTAANF